METRGPRRLWRNALALIGLGAAVAGAGWAAVSARRAATGATALRTVPVRRADLDLTLRAGGRVESAKKTLIECELENLKVSSEGRSFSSGSRSTILEVIPEGTTVRRDDVLCRIDSSAYEELVRQQEMKVTQAENDHRRAVLDVRAAEIALDEYRYGLLPQQVQAIDGQVALAQVDVRRQKDRLEWSSRMLAAGYISAGQNQAEEQKLLRGEYTLRNALGVRSLLTRFRGPITTTQLEMALGSARTTAEYQDLRLRRTKERLDTFRKQVDRCTVRAPHDGFVIYADDDDDEPIEAGAEVHQRMDLFYLPDLGDMEVHAVLNESVIDRVKPNMAVRVTLEGLPGRPVEGHLLSISSLPMTAEGVARFTNVKSYIGRIRLHSSPRGLLPGMTAEVEIQTGGAEDALVIPSEASFEVAGKDYCYVAGPSGLRRREVSLGVSTSDLLEVRSGLSEGEAVVERPTSLDPATTDLADSSEDDEGKEQGDAASR